MIKRHLITTLIGLIAIGSLITSAISLNYAQLALASSNTADTLVYTGTPTFSLPSNVCGQTTSVVLYAGQTTNAGTVTVSNDETFLYVTYTTTGGWMFQETHLDVAHTSANVPQTKSGNPKVGNFSYNTTHSPLVTSYTYAVSLVELETNADIGDNGELVIAAHAVVVMLDANGKIIKAETGWGNGTRFTERGNWAMYISYVWQDCEDPKPEAKSETAWAYAKESNQCFLNIDMNGDKKGDFNRWGWTNGPLSAGTYTFDLYAAAGQCNLSKGTLVGTVTVNYNGSQATVTFNTLGTNPDTDLPYTLTETHLYVGNEMLDRSVNGDYTVSPGQFDGVHDPIANMTTDSFTVTGLSGDIYVVAHASVYGFPL